MAAYLEVMYADLRAAIAAAWVDVPADGIWEAENLSLIPWDNTTPPFATVVCGKPEPWDESPGDSIVFRFTPQISWVGASTGDSSAQRGKVETLRDYLLTNGLAHSQVWDIESMDWSDANETNKFFISKLYNHRSGVLVPVIMVGESWGS